MSLRQHQYFLSGEILQRLSSMPNVIKTRPANFINPDDLTVVYKTSKMEVLSTEDKEFQIVVDKANAKMYVLFYRRQWTNFAEQEVKAIQTGQFEWQVQCPEMTFKTACYAMHAELGACKEGDLINVFTASTPVEVKNSTRKIKSGKFNPALWDARSKDAMRWSVGLRLKSLTAFSQMVLYSNLAREYGIMAHDVCLIESTSRDQIWATGKDIQELVDEMTIYAGDNLYVDVVTQKGTNYLGECLNDAFLCVCSLSSVEDYAKWFDKWVEPLFLQKPITK